MYKIFTYILLLLLISCVDQRSEDKDQDSITSQCVDNICTIVVNSYSETESSTLLGSKYKYKNSIPIYIINANFQTNAEATLATQSQLNSKGLDSCTNNICLNSYDFDLSDEISTVISAFSFNTASVEALIETIISVKNPTTPDLPAQKIAKKAIIDTRGGGIGAVGVIYNAPASESGGGGAFNSGTYATQLGGATSGVFSNGISWQTMSPTTYNYQIKFTCPSGYAVLTNATTNTDYARITATSNLPIKYVLIKTAPNGSGGYTRYWTIDEVGTSAKYQDGYYYGEYANNVGEGPAEARTGMSCVASGNINNWRYDGA